MVNPSWLYNSLIETMISGMATEPINVEMNKSTNNVKKMKSV